MKIMATKEIKIYERDVTPELAQELLKKNTSNRRLSEKHVNFLLMQMRSGNWLRTGTTNVKIDRKGKLLDGQHTLNAIIKFGKAVPLTIAEGMKEEVFAVIDTGKGRSAGDIATASGFKNAHSLAAIAKAVILYQNGFYSLESGDGRLKATNMNILDFIEKHEELQEIAEFCAKIYKRFRYLSTTQLGMLYYLFSQKNQTKCDTFFEQYSMGTDLKADSPIRLLRDKLMKDSLNKTKLSGRDKVALVILAWNAFISNRPLTAIALRKDYEFPKPI
jgi:hypothetical protein